MGSEGNAYDYLNTQYELLKSQAMAERVVSHLALDQDESFFAPRGASLVSMIRSALFPAPEQEELSPSDLQMWAAGIVMGNVSVSPVPQSRLVDVIYKDPDPGRAQRIANGYAKAYMDSNIDKRFKANQYAKTVLEDHIKHVKLRLDASEDYVPPHAEREKIIATFQ